MCDFRNLRFDIRFVIVSINLFFVKQLRLFLESDQMGGLSRIVPRNLASISRCCSRKGHQAHGKLARLASG